MTPEQALANLIEYYCEEEDHHDYIRESWKTLKDLYTQSTNVMSCKNCKRLYNNGRQCVLSVNHCVRRAEDFYTDIIL
jgi:hypothetical protein